MIFLTAIVTKKETGEGDAMIGGQKFTAKPASLDVLCKCIEENARA
ncbi:MAG: hypothetical protein ABI318_13925 [Chthoniobacteraceae bacterium]